MFDRMSPRQKAAASIAVLGLDQRTLAPLDRLVSTVFANPLVGAVTGLDFSSVAECLEQFYANGDVVQSSVFTGVRRQLSNDTFRGAISSAIVKAISTLDEETQQGISLALDKVSQMNIPQFQREFHDVDEFIREGLLAFLADDTPPQIPWVECPHCLMSFESPNKE